MSLFNIYHEVVDTCASANFLVGKTLPQVDSEGSPLERSKQASLRILDKYNRPPKNFISRSGQYLELLCCGHACSDCSFGRLRVLVGHSPGYPEVITKVAEAYPQSACCLKTCQWIAAAQRKLTTIFCGKVSMKCLFFWSIDFQAACEVRLVDGSAQIAACPATLRQKLQIQLPDSFSHRELTLNQPVLPMEPHRWPIG